MAGPFSLRERKALATGANAGIGLAIAVSSRRADAYIVSPGTGPAPRRSA